MSRIAYDLSRVKGIAMDVDGVISPSTMTMDPSGVPMRMVNVKDGYAMRLAVACGLKLAIITGADIANIEPRMKALGVDAVYMRATKKTDVLKQWMADNNLKPEQVAFIGDDIPDYEAMRMVGLPICPRDGVEDIKRISTYISPVDGGAGVIRDVIEQILRAIGKWMSTAEAFEW